MHDLQETLLPAPPLLSPLPSSMSLMGGARRCILQPLAAQRTSVGQTRAKSSSGTAAAGMGAPGAAGAPPWHHEQCGGTELPQHEPRLPSPERCSASFPAAAAPAGPLLPSAGLQLQSLFERGVIYPGFLSSDATALEADHSQTSQC